ncbi:MAG: zinc-binding dehydrogenase [SAR202 cluster bacterium]|nr:zinc-binding dehydrogenase [SAR202 cluster bacterium]
MKAGRIAGPRRMEIVDVPEPTLRIGEVLVKVEKVSICGSDIRPFSTVLPEEKYPMSPGRPIHECAGVVQEAWADGFNPGQRVIVFPYEQGGLREKVVVPPSGLVAVPDYGSLDTWIMCQPMGTVLYSVSRVGNVVDKNVLVLGQGAIGLSFTKFLSGMNARELIVADLEEYRLKVSRKFGATQTVNVSKENIFEAVKDLTHGEGPDVVVEAAGEHESVRQSIALCKKFGTVIWFGMTHNEYFAIDFQQIRDKDLTMIGTSSARAGTMPQYVRQVVRMVEQKRVDPTPMITHKLKVEEVQKALEMYEKRTDGVIKVTLDM